MSRGEIKSTLFADGTVVTPPTAAPLQGTFLELTEMVAPTTPASGFARQYVDTDGMLHIIDDGGIDTIVGSGGSGSGEKNYISNPSGARAVTGWVSVGDLAATRTTTAAELPREFTTGTGIKIIADADVQSVADYVYIDFTLDDVDLNKKLKIQWSQKVTGTYTAGQLEVVITSQADRTTVLHAALVPAIPSADFVLQTSFDSGSTAALSMVIRATADMTTNGGIVISDATVGPGVQPQGYAGSGNIAWTPTGTWTANTTYSGTYRRVGTTMSGRVLVSTTGAPTAATLRINLPTGLTIDTTALPGSGVYYLGDGVLTDTSTSDRYAVAVTANSADSQLTIRLYTQNANTDTSINRFTTGITATVPTTIATGDSLTLEFNNLPIAEWAGTVNLSQNDVEYAWNSQATLNTSDTSSFGYGPSGVAILAHTVGTTLRAQFQTPVQATDHVDIEISSDSGVTWQPVYSNAGGSLGFIRQGAASYGIALTPVGLTGVDVGFQSTSRPNNATYAGAGQAWSAFTTYRWRVKKSSGGQAVGWGAATATSSGLIAPYNAASLVHGGTYTPTIVGTNLTSITARQHNYSRVGSIVTVAGSVTGTVTATSTPTSITVTLPIASSFTGSGRASGTATLFRGTGAIRDAGYVEAVASTQTVTAAVVGTGVGSGATANFYYTFQYEIQ